MIGEKLYDSSKSLTSKCDITLVQCDKDITPMIYLVF
jgi:hypothetical protein